MSLAWRGSFFQTGGRRAVSKRIRILALGLLLALALTGCGLSDLGPGLQLRDILPGRAQSPEDFGSPILQETAPVYWAREHLAEDVGEAYDLVYAAVAARSEESVRLSVGEAELKQALEAIRIDHPELFWFAGEASFVTSAVPGVAQRTEATFRYTRLPEQIAADRVSIEAFWQGCLAALEVMGAETDYEKILTVYRYIITRTDYDETEEDQSILSVMDGHRGTCAGYARSFQFLMNRLGIPCTLAIGRDASGESHGWNVVNCGGDWYQIDVTWGDPVDAFGNPGDEIQYTYCMITDQEIYRDHVLESSIPMPVCTATEYNYYVQTGRLFDAWDRQAYAQAAARARESGEDWLAVRFTSPEAYEAAGNALFAGEEAFSVLQELGVLGAEGRIVYAQNDLFREISLRLS